MDSSPPVPPATPEPAAAPPGRRFAGFTGAEARVVFGAGAAYALRMLGTYMALPVLSPYAAALPGAAPLWTGLSVGAYGLTQAVFQIPMGLLGDRRGRGLVLALGLVVFGFGSWICAAAASAPVLVLGRLVQGVGATASTMIALLGDRTREAVRTRAMAAMGVLIGGAFAFGMVGGPAVAARLGVPWLFGFACVSSFVGLALLPWALHARTAAGGAITASAPAAPAARTPSPAATLRALARPALVVLDAGILVLHLTLTALFVILPLRLAAHIAPAYQWRVYAPVLLAGFAAMALASRAAEAHRGRRGVLAAGSACLAAACLLLARDGGLGELAVALGFFVVGFACLEPTLAAQVTRHSEAALRGAAAGVFNTVQFGGVFLGGLAAGAALGGREPLLFLGLAVAQGLWLAAGWRTFAGAERPTPPPAAPPSPARARSAPTATARSGGN
jgi:MFS family permease